MNSVLLAVLVLLGGALGYFGYGYLVGGYRGRG